MDTQKLRQRILDLAIRGKLVPQDPNDEPASVLLDRIRAEKERLIAEGKIKRPKAKKSTDKPHYQQFTLPFDIPDSWEWVRLEDIGEIITGSTPSKSDTSNYGCEYPFYKPNDLEQGFYTTKSRDNLSAKGMAAARELPIGSVLVTCIGATIGKTGLIRTKGASNQQINAIIPNMAVNSEYLYYTIIGEYFQNSIKESASSTTLPILNKGDFSKLLIPIPPKDEQKRIIDLIQSLFDFVSDIENAVSNLKDSIKTAKSKILDLALQGKLVPQDSADEPAADMLRRINPKAKIITDTPHYMLRPKGWIFSELYNVSRIIMGQSPNGDSINNVDGIEFHQGKMYFGDIFISVSPDKTNSPTKVIDGENILLSVRAPVGAVNKCNRKICIGRGLAAISPSEVLDETFVFYIFQFLRPEFEAKATGSTFKAITRVVVKSALIPIPPINEQRRIVARVMELYSVLDEIESSLR